MSGVVKFVVGVGAMALGIATGQLWLAKAGFYLANIGLLEEASKLFLPKPKVPNIRQDVEYSGTVTPRRIIYGKLRVGGLNTVRPLVVDPDGRLLQQVLTIAGHPCNAVSAVYFNQDTVGTRTAVTGTANDGLVTSGEYANLAWVRCYTGAQTSVDYKLNAAASGLWTSSHIGYGLTYAAITFQLDENAYASGKPQVSFLVEGKKCYDPRLDTTPGANPTNASYIAYTENPAIQLCDYLMDSNLGCGIAATKIDWTLVVAAANICDENVSIPGSTTQKRYTSSVMIEAAGGRREDNIKTLAGAMMGVCYRQGGTYRMWAGAAQSPSFALTEADIIDTAAIRLETPSGEKYNFIRGTFTDAARNYQEVEFEPRGNAAYESDDGRRVPKTVNLDTVTNAYEAQRNAIILLRRSRMAKTVTARFSLAAYKIRPFAIGTLTFADIGWTAQRVVCTSWNFVGDGTIEMSLQEDSSTIWDDPTVASYAEPGSGGGATLSSYAPDPPDNLTATSLKGAIEFAWDMPLATLPGDVIELWEYTSSTPFASASRVWQGTASRATIYKSDTTTRYYWVRARASNGNPSSTEPTTTGLAGVALAGPTDGTDGEDGLTLALSTTSFPVACTAAGVPVSGAFDNATGQVTVYSGSTDVTASATYSSTNTGCTGSVNTATNTPVTGAKGSYRITAMSANTGYLEITVTYDGKSIKGRFTVSKVLAGSTSGSQVDDSLTINNTSSYTGTQGGPLTLAVGPSGTIHCEANHGYETTGTRSYLAGKFQYRTTPGSGSWVDVATETQDSLGAASGEPSSLDINDTMSGPASALNYEFQYINRRYSGSSTLTNSGSPKITVWWSA